MPSIPRPRPPSHSLSRPARYSGLPAPWTIGFGWGLLVSLIPLCDFLVRPPREDLAEYNFQLIREAPPGLSAVIGLLLLMNGVPALLAVWRCGIDFKQAGLYPTLALLYILVVAASLFGLEASALVYIVLVAYCFALATLMSALASGARDVIRGFLTAVAIGIAATLTLMVVDGNYSYGRLMGRSGPNYWGMASIAALFASLAIGNKVVKVSIVIVAITVVVLCQSRGAMMAIGVGAAVIWSLYVYHAERQRRLLLVICTALFIIAAIILFGDVIATKLLLVENRNRGVESGGTGRFAAWAQAYELFTNSPWLGVGYRQHEGYITAASSAHNAFLAALADTGLIGFAFYLALMAGGAAMAIRKALQLPDPVRFAVAGLTISFLAIGLVERVGVNTGNALSLAMIFSTAWAYRHDVVRREACWVRPICQSSPPTEGRRA